MRFYVKRVYGKCGHSEEVSVIARKDADIQELEQVQEINWRNCLCPECTEQLRAEAEAEELADLQSILTEELGAPPESEYPALTGTEKQVAWAEDLRRYMLLNAARYYGDVGYPTILDYRGKYTIGYETREFPKSLLESMKGEVASIILSHTSARWFIDNRSTSMATLLPSLLDNLYSKSHGDTEAKKREAEALAELKAEETARLNALTAKPETERYDGIVKIVTTPSSIEARYPYSPTFIEVSKDQGFRWNDGKNVWEKKFDPRFTSIPDRAAEAGHKYLAEGYVVRFENEETLNKAVSGQWEDYHQYWIDYDKKTGKLYVLVPPNTDLASTIKRIPSAKGSSSKGFSVDLEFYRKVLDLMDVNPFKITPEAEEAIDRYRTEFTEKVRTVELTEHEEKTLGVEDKLQAILESSDEVLSKLIDD